MREQNRVFDAEDDNVAIRFMSAIRDLRDLKPRRMANGILFTDNAADIRNTNESSRAVYFGVDGDIRLRFAQCDGSPFDQATNALAIAYALSQEFLFYLGASPLVVGEFVMTLYADRQRYEPQMPSSYREGIEIDLAAESFDQAFAPLLIRCLRTEDVAWKLDKARDCLTDAGQELGRNVMRLHERWLRSTLAGPS